MLTIHIVEWRAEHIGARVDVLSGVERSAVGVVDAVQRFRRASRVAGRLRALTTAVLNQKINKLIDK